MAGRYTAEEKLLLRGLRGVVTGEPSEPPPRIDWELLFDLAAAHNLLPALYYSLPAAALPAEIARELESAARRSRMRFAVMAGAFDEIHRRFAAAGIEALPLKGLALAQRVYPSPALRYFDDLDILVRPAAAEAAWDLLQELGYRPHPKAPRPDWHHYPPLIHDAHRTMVELHVDVVRRSRPGWDLDGIWQRSSSLDQPSPAVMPIMSDPDALILTAIHARHNLYNRLAFLLDAALLARRVAAGDGGWTETRRLAAEAGARCALDFLTGTAARLFELADLPVADCPGGRRWIAVRVRGWPSLSPPRAALRQGPVPKLIEIALLDSWRDSLRLAARLAAPPAAFVRQGYGRDGRRRTAYWARLKNRLGLVPGQLVRLIRNR